jgi:metal-responsive CopG/Arc/MetJ family transcriptional regulator
MTAIRNKKQVGLRFDPKLLNMVDKVAKQKGLTRTEFVERAVKHVLMKEVK